MKLIRKSMAMFVAVMALCVAMSATAFAAEEPAFVDVGTDSPWYEGVEYAVEHGITVGTGEGKFSPDQDITVRQWAVMICRAYDKQVEEGEGKPFGTLQLTKAFDEGWLDVGAMIAPDSSMCRAYAYESIFRAAKIPVFSVERDDNAVPYENRYVKVAKENGLCKENDHGLDSMTRGEAVQLIYLIQTKNIEIAKPQILDMVYVVNADHVASLDAFLQELAKVPESILYEFNDRDWAYRIDSEYIDDFSERVGMDCAGCCSYMGKSIFVKKPFATVHEFGHFYHYFVGFDSKIEDLFVAEAEGVRDLLGDYATTNHKEYFAEVFDYWIQNSDNAMNLNALAEVAPETHAYFASLEDGNWKTFPEF